MRSIAEIHRKAIRDNEPYFRRGLMTAQESDSVARRNVVKYLSAQSRITNSLVNMVLPDEGYASVKDWQESAGLI